MRDAYDLRTAWKPLPISYNKSYCCHAHPFVFYVLLRLFYCLNKPRTVLLLLSRACQRYSGIEDTFASCTPRPRSIRSLRIQVMIHTCCIHARVSTCVREAIHTYTNTHGYIDIHTRLSVQKKESLHSSPASSSAPTPQLHQEGSARLSSSPSSPRLSSHHLLIYTDRHLHGCIYRKTDAHATPPAVPHPEEWEGGEAEREKC